MFESLKGLLNYHYFYFALCWAAGIFFSIIVEIIIHRLFSK